MRRTIGLLATLVIALSAGAANGDDRDIIVASCAQNLGLPAAGCDCVADKAMSEFSESEFAFFMAVIQGDRAAQATAQGNLTVEEAMHIGDRMNQMPVECAG